VQRQLGDLYILDSHARQIRNGDLPRVFPSNASILHDLSQFNQSVAGD